MPRKKADAAPAAPMVPPPEAVIILEPVESPLAAVALPPGSPPPEWSEAIPILADYIKARERDDIVLVRVTYPGAAPHIYQSKFSGIEVTDGPLSCTYSDGSTE
jgi:hypothetical protein